MADASLLSVLAGTDPLSPQILDALHAEQARGMVSDPANWQNQGLAGGIARTLAGFLAPSAAPQVAQIAGQRVAAQPDEAKLLASADPFAALAANPDQYSPLARAMVLNGANPLNVAQTREAQANAALAGLNVKGFTAAQGRGAGAPGGIAAPAAKGIAPPSSGAPSGNLSVLGSGHFPQQEQPQTDPIVAAASMSPQQRQSLVANPQSRAALLQRLRVLQAQHAQQAHSQPAAPPAPM